MKSTLKYSVVLLAVLAASFTLPGGNNIVFVYGPQLFVQTSGKPTTTVEKFSVPAGVTTPFTLDVLDGFAVDKGHDWDWYRGQQASGGHGYDMTYQVTGATIEVNGVVVLSPSDFNGHPIFITKPVTLKQGATNTLEVTVQGEPGSFIFLGITGTKGSVDTTKPQLTITAPANGTITKNASITVGGTVTDQSAVTLTVNGTAVTVSNGSFSTSVSLTEGVDVITVVAIDASGNQSTQKVMVTKDSTPPTLTVISPINGLITNASSVSVYGTVVDSTAVTVTVNGTSVVVASDSFRTSAALIEGTNTITVIATDAAGNTTTAVVRTVRRYSVAPVITISNPSNGLITNQASVTISGSVQDSTAVTLTINGSPVTVGTGGSFSQQVSLAEGTNVYTISATDAAGNTGSKQITVIKDTILPALSITSPVDSTITNNATIIVSGTVKDSTAVTVAVNGNSITVTDGSFQTSVTVYEGHNVITIVATDAAGNSTTIVRHVNLYTTPPTLTVTSPSDSLITNQSQVQVTGTVVDSTTTVLRINGNIVPIVGGSFNTSLVLSEGMNTITIIATDAAGNSATITKHVTLYAASPVLSVSTPTDSSVTNQSQVNVAGTVSDSTAVVLKVNGAVVPVMSGVFSISETLSEGFNTITVTATDAAGNSTTITRIIRLYTTTPVITVQSPQNGSTTNDSSIALSGTVADSTNVTLTVNGSAVSVNANGSFSIAFPLSVGTNQIVISVTDAAGNTGSTSLSVTRSGIILPPDPATVAPKIDQTVVTTVGSATKFLYTGSNPIQTGVDTTAMSYVRSAAIRGKILSRSNQPLPGVTVSILNHPEFGQTLSRADGMYDMAINGGGQLTVNYAMTGYLTAQRQVNTPWQSYAYIDSVVLVQLDPNVTVVKLGDSVSVARGSVVTDQDGTRQATLIFQPGTQATMKIVHYINDSVTMGGNSQIMQVPIDTESVPLDTLSVRATEYTVGANGPQAMPAKLPPSSAYTYCVELSSDEAIAAGATTVDFSKPVVYYIENFLNLPVGTNVPAGYYDKSKGQWIAIHDGLILRILGTGGGIASIDINGNGAAASRASLDSVGIDSLEQVKLASLYSPGQALWRVSVSHFSSDDFNYSFVLEGDGTTNNQNLNGPNVQPTSVCPSNGSIIGIQNQSLGQSLSITGTPFSMFYNSNNTAGFKQANVISLPLTGSTLPLGIVGVEMKVDVAGQEFDHVFAPSPNLNYTFAWDGKDAFGRLVQGEQPVNVAIGYYYRMEYVAIPKDNYSFSGILGGVQVMIIHNAESYCDSFPEWRNWNSTIGKWNVASEGLGGWNFDIHQKYDPDVNKIYYGDGTVSDASPLINVANLLQEPSGYIWIAVAPDGTIYFSEQSSSQVWKRCTDGSIVLVAGTGTYGYSGDGGPATRAMLHSPSGLALGADGSLYIADTYNDCIRRVDPLGIIATYAGNGGGHWGYGGDGGLAVNSYLNLPAGLAIGTDGSLFIADQGNTVIRMVNPAGIIKTVAGNGQGGYGGDGGPALQAKLSNPFGVDVDGQGNIYIADYGNRRIRKVTPQGIITTIAGNGKWNAADPNGDGGPATNAELEQPMGVTVGRDGSVYIDDYGTNNYNSWNGSVRRVSPEGIISTYLNQSKLKVNDVYAHSPMSSAIGPDGNFYFSDDRWSASGSSVYFYGDIIHEVTPAFPGVSGTESDIASEDGSEVYVFDEDGKHLKTLDALTNARLYSFTYD
ncbi:MAG: Ig-like domain-containing protein, partial [Candidatus Kryptoniota bacterium]